jgi:hypothetical protein
MKFHDKEELELMKSIETEAWVSVNNLEEGMPYQTLVSSLIHKYLMGRLQEQREQEDV